MNILIFKFILSAIFKGTRRRKYVRIGVIGKGKMNFLFNLDFISSDFFKKREKPAAVSVPAQTQAAVTTENENNLNQTEAEYKPAIADSVQVTNAKSPTDLLP